MNSWGEDDRDVAHGYSGVWEACTTVMQKNCCEFPTGNLSAYLRRAVQTLFGRIFEVTLCDEDLLFFVSEKHCVSHMLYDMYAPHLLYPILTRVTFHTSVVLWGLVEA